MFFWKNFLLDVWLGTEYPFGKKVFKALKFLNPLKMKKSEKINRTIIQIFFITLFFTTFHKRVLHCQKYSTFSLIYILVTQKM